jgi:hypothetical protein
LAHIKSDEELVEILLHLYSLLSENGKLIIFEQTGPKQQQGISYVRRTNMKYKEVAKNCGFNLSSCLLVTFSAHRFFERYISKFYRKYFVHGETYEEKCFNANKSKLFCFLSNIFTFLSFNRLRKNSQTYGNTFFVFKKK